MTNSTAVDRFALSILLLGAILISFSGIFVKLSETEPTSTGFYRLFLPLPVLFLGMLADGRRRHDGRLPRIGRRGWIGIHCAGFFLAADLIAWHWSLRYIGVAPATLLGNTAPLWVALVGYFLFKERFSALFIAGLSIAFVGVSILILGGNKELRIDDGLGVFLAILGAIGYAGYLRGVKVARGSVGLSQVMFWTAATGAAWLLPVALLTEDVVIPITYKGWLAVIGLAFLSQIVGQGLISWSLAHLPAAFSSVSLLINPVAAAIFAWITLGEALSGLQILGGLAVLLGIYVSRPRASIPKEVTIPKSNST